MPPESKPTPAPALPQAATATLAILSAGEELAKRVESHLRNAGHPVRVIWLTDLEDLEDAIRRRPPDLVLCSEGMPKASLKEVLALGTRLAPDLPILLLSQGPVTAAGLVVALETGARDLVSAAETLQLRHLARVCLRELAVHYSLRELRSTRVRLADYEARHQKLMAGTADAVVHVQEGIITHANTAFANLLGQSTPGALIGNPLMDLIAADNQPQIKQFLKLFTQGKAKTDKPLELTLAGENGQTRKVTAQLSVGQSNGDRLLELLIRSQTPPSASAAAAPATGAWSGRIELFQALNNAIKANVGMHRALVVMMVDAFGSVEQRLGFHEAEQALHQLAELSRQRLGPKESMYRFSTAILAMVVSRPSPTEFESLAETLRRDIAAQLFKTDNYEAHLTATVVCYPLSPNDQAAQVVDNAVREVRKLSRDGGNRITVLGPAAHAAQVELAEQQKADQVRKALVENRLKLAYQSIASLEGSERQHFDVLARMLDEAGQEVPARDFIPAAEKHGLIVAVDRWVLMRALIVLAKRQGAQDSSSLFVRLSEQSVREGDALLKWLSELLKQRPLRKEELVISIQESIVETHVGKAKALSDALRKLNAGIAMDYFGVGNNSAQMLDHLSPQYVRFHYSFTRDFNNPVLQKKLVELMEVAKQRQIKTIVGQVEDANAMARLWQLGVNYIQGFHIQAPEAVLMASDVHHGR